MKIPKLTSNEQILCLYFGLYWCIALNVLHLKLLRLYWYIAFNVLHLKLLRLYWRSVAPIFGLYWCIFIVLRFHCSYKGMIAFHAWLQKSLFCMKRLGGSAMEVYLLMSAKKYLRSLLTIFTWLLYYAVPFLIILLWNYQK